MNESELFPKESPNSTGPFGEQIRVVGQVVRAPGSTLTVKSVLPGRVEHLDIAPGDYVKTGTLLVKLHSHEMLQMQGDLLRAGDRARLAENRMNAGHELYEIQGISRIELQTREQENFAAKLEVDRARSELLDLGLSYEQVKELIETRSTEFLPTMDEGSIVVQPFQIPSVSLNQSLKVVQRIEAAIMELPEVVRVVSRTGRSDISSDPMGVGESDTYVLLKPRSEWTTATSKAGLVDAIRSKMSEIPGVDFGYTQPIQMRVDELLSGVKSQIAVKIFGDDLGKLARIGDQVAAVIKNVEGSVDVKVEAVEGLGYLQLSMHRRRLARLGVSVAQVSQLIETAIGGKVVTTVPEGDRRTDVVVRLPREFTKNVENLQRLPLSTPAGERVLPGEVIDIDLVEGPAQISREDGSRRVVVELNVVGRDIGGFVKEARDRINSEIDLPDGYFVTSDILIRAVIKPS